MPEDRRSFLRRLGAFTGAALIPSALSRSLASDIRQKLRIMQPEDPGDEAFWYLIRQSFQISPSIMNLNNGAVSPHPIPVRDALEQYNRMANEAPSYFMWRVMERGRETVRRQLAELAGVSDKEIAIQRNTTEALGTVTFGLQLNRGDEVVLSRQDYPNMLHAWEQRAKRDGIILKYADLDLPSSDSEALTEAYTRLFTKKTRLVHITHMINWLGQILPVRKIAEVARENGILVSVDGAHSFGQLDFNIPDLLCDFYGTSLHKWLCAPFGTGMLYVKEERIPDLWPLLSATEPESGDIRKFEHLGTRSIPIEMAISPAIDFHLLIGAKRKEDRLRYLKDYWTSRLREIPGVTIHTPPETEFSCGIANFTQDGWKPDKLVSRLFVAHNIHSVYMNYAGIDSIRISPNVYTLPSDLDRLVAAVRDLAADR